MNKPEYFEYGSGLGSGMPEWKTLPRSIRLVTHEVSLDVWPMGTTTGREYHFTVLDNRTGRYLASGVALTQDAACELALKAGKL